ncbi:hypothetical protein [Parasphingopyxis marina]|uniref:DUF8021 domain-containing protein n=1 Tax=Parasphingopyxis marina TaxID=2761622 RepID=A0A842HW05_9SPHN|nr:hypothetical protein [Parasphingopyxis marina]MBC2777085.1 hypothetical protein [Parasphingopyxis marina]
MTDQSPAFDRQKLYAVLDRYLAALEAQDPGQVEWADTVRHSENNVMIDVGDGLWNTISSRGDYDLRFADTRQGQVGHFGSVIEPHEESGFTVRIGVTPDYAISEVETIVVRQLDSGIQFKNQKWYRKPILEEEVAPERRATRERMIELSNGYFETLELNDGEIHTKFHPDCQRVENGVQTTNNPEFGDIVPVAALGCEEQFRMGNYRYDDRLRARRFPLVDEERGLVLGAGFIDHSGKLDRYQLTDGTWVDSLVRRPHSFNLLELFKIQDDMLWQIEANFFTVPYNMPSPWDD